MIGYVAPIVEGDGDVQAVPKLLGAISQDLVTLRPVRFPKTKLLVAGGLERAAKIARANIRLPGESLVLVLIDADEDCAATLGPELLRRVRTSAHDVECFVAIAVREYESWIVGGLTELNITSPETAGKPKDRLREINGGRYSETVDQQVFTSRIDVHELARRSPSFRRLREKLTGMPPP